MTFDDVFNEFMSFTKYEYSAHTFVSKQSTYKKHIKPLIGAMDIQSLKYATLQSVLSVALESGKAPKTVTHIRDIIRTTFKHAARCEYIEKDPSAHLVVKKIDNRRFLLLNDEEVSRFVSAVKNEPDVYYRALFMFLLHGRRVNEVRQLRWGWLNLSSASVAIPAIHSKDRYSHSYALSEYLVELLKNLPRTSDFVFPSRKTGVQFVDLRKPFNRILNRAGIDKEKMRIHDIRHLVGTSLIKSGRTLEDVKYALGHRSITTSMRYVTNDAEHSRKSVELIMSLSIGVKYE